MTLTMAAVPGSKRRRKACRHAIGEETWTGSFLSARASWNLHGQLPWKNRKASRTRRRRPFSGYAAKTLPIGVAYAVWTGIGVVATAAFSMATGAEPASLAKAVLLLGIVGCIAGLRILSS